MSVDALRIPVFNFFIEHFDGFAAISTQDNQDTNIENPYEVLESLIPSDYKQTQYFENASGSFVEYENATGATISLDIIIDGADMNIDTEGAKYTEVFLSEYKAILIEKNGYQLIWTDEAGTTFVFHSSILSQKQILEICNTLTTLLQVMR